MADEYLYGLHPYLRSNSRVQRLGSRGPGGIPGGVDPRGLGSEAAPSMPITAMPTSSPYVLGQRGTALGTQAAQGLDQFGAAVKRRFSKVAYTEQTRFNPGTSVRHLEENTPKLNYTGPTKRMNQDMVKASLMQSSATTRSVPQVDNLVKKIVAEKEAVSLQKRRIQIAADLEREAMALETLAIQAANKGVERLTTGSIPEIEVKVGASSSMNTALVVGALAIGVLAATLWAKRV
jgi:hypothetical protein